MCYSICKAATDLIANICPDNTQVKKTLNLNVKIWNESIMLIQY